MVVELGGPNQENPLPEDVDYAEHSAFAKAKKVVDGPMVFSKATGDILSLPPIVGAVIVTSASISLLPVKAYRIIASTTLFFRLSKGNSTAVVTDMYLPADTPIVIATRRDWDTLSFIRATADGIIQAIEVN